MTRLEIHEARSRLIRAGYHVVQMNRCLCAYRRGISVALYINNGTVPVEAVSALLNRAECQICGIRLFGEKQFCEHCGRELAWRAFHNRKEKV